MADSERRIVVEGVEFAQLVQFPKILRAITASFQPPRLVLGLLMVAALMTVGRIWDSFREPGIAPAGATVDWTPQQAQDDLRAALAEYGGVEDRPEGELDARDVAAAIQAAYADERDDLAEEADESEEGAERLGREDRRYQATLERIESVRPRGVFEATVGDTTTAFNALVRGLVTLELGMFYQGVKDVVVGTPVNMWGRDKIFTIVYGLLFLVLMAIGGGALARMTATETAYGEKMRLQEALDFAVGSWKRLILSLLLPLVFVAALCALLLVGGFLLMNVPWLDTLGGALYGVAVLIGFFVVFLLAGYALGFSLLVPAVACENCDALDAQQRAYSYVLSRPLHLLGYGVVSLVGLALGFVLASLFAVAVLNVTGSLVDAATGNPAVSAAHSFALFDLSPQRTAPVPLATHSAVSAWLVSFWQTVIVCLVAGYVFAYYFGGSTIMYLLMRRTCDGQDMTEIWEPGVVPGTMADEPAGDEAPEAQER